MKTYLRIEAKRSHYSPEDCRTMTVGELINLLEDCDPDMPVILSHDSGYTYGGISYCDITEDSYYDGEEEE